VRSLNIKALFKLSGCVVEKLLVEEVGVQVKMRADRRCKPCCPECGGVLAEHRKGQIAVYDLPLADKTAVWVTLPAIQGRCPDCRCFFTPRPPEIHPLRDATWRLMRRVAAWASACPATTVAAMFDISESTVRRYEMDVLNADLPEPLLDGIEILLIDEKAVRKGHGYVTLVLNGRTGELLHMAEGKKKESLAAFFDKLTDTQKKSIRAVCIDRNGAYRAVLAESLPHADVVHDRFHLVANLNAAIDQVRRGEWHKAKDEGKRVIKGSRYLLTAGSEHLDDDGKQRLVELTRLNERLSAAYILKEDFRWIYASAKGATEATRRLTRWAATAMSSGIEPLRAFARGLLRDLPAAVAFFKHRVTSGPIEAFNNQIARLIHRSCGIANLGYLYLKMRAQSLQRI
jgi:transposase